MVSRRGPYVRVWCLGYPAADGSGSTRRSCEYRELRTEPLLCPRCGSEVIAVPINTMTPARSGEGGE